MRESGLLPLTTETVPRGGSNDARLLHVRLARAGPPAAGTGKAGNPRELPCRLTNRIRFLIRVTTNNIRHIGIINRHHWPHQIRRIRVSRHAAVGGPRSRCWSVRGPCPTRSSDPPSASLRGFPLVPTPPIRRRCCQRPRALSRRASRRSRGNLGGRRRRALCRASGRRPPLPRVPSAC